MTTLSLITATKNSAATLKQCLDSVAAQTRVPDEHMIIDASSTDGCAELARHYVGHPLTVVGQRQRGLYQALNQGIQDSTGDVIGFLHSDDFYPEPSVLARVCELFSDPSVSAVYGDLDIVDRIHTDRVIRRWRGTSPQPLMTGWAPAHPTLFVRRRWYERCGYFDSDLTVAADYLSMLRFFSHRSFNARYHPGIKVTMRCGGVSTKSFGCLFTNTLQDWIAVRRAGFGFVGGLSAVFCKKARKLSQLFAYENSKPRRLEHAGESRITTTFMQEKS
jgi:glycosyltransferase involved in cell wall biosynthesis